MHRTLRINRATPQTLLHVTGWIAMLRVPFVDHIANPARGTHSDAISPRTRCLAVLVGVGLLAILVLANRLRPDPRGLGTHQQLGLPPCSLWVVTGVRCPACGMTTSWAYATRGQLRDALRTHVGGTILAFATAVCAVSALAIAARGKWPLRQPSEAVTISLIVVGAAMLVGEWVVRLWFE
jgi:hypothetical protein